MNKNRKRATQAGQNASLLLCSSGTATFFVLYHNVVFLAVTSNEKCNFGESCRYEHDVRKFWTNKEADIGTQCPLLRVLGECRFGVACRFAELRILFQI
jgi:hypothetical protein